MRLKGLTMSGFCVPTGANAASLPFKLERSSLTSEMTTIERIGPVNRQYIGLNLDFLDYTTLIKLCAIN